MYINVICIQCIQIRIQKMRNIQENSHFSPDVEGSKTEKKRFCKKHHLLFINYLWVLPFENFGDTQCYKQ